MANANDHQYAVDVAAPVRVAYNQWTQFEDFPKFMAAVESVSQVADDRLIWEVDFGGISRRFETLITEQTPDQRIAWQTIDGPHHAGVVTFHRIDDDTTRVTLQMDFEPEGFLESVADTFGFVTSRITDDMENFKTFITDREAATGAWRGTITPPTRPERKTA